MSVLQDEDFRGFVTARGPALLRTAYLLTGDRQQAEDLVQTALEKTIGHWHEIRVVAAAEAYVRRTMYREQVSVWRRRRVTEAFPGDLPERPEPQPPDLVENKIVLRRALLRLGRRQRTVLVLRFFEDLTERQVAEELGISVGTVKSQTAKALRTLREHSAELSPSAPVAGEELS